MIFGAENPLGTVKKIGIAGFTGFARVRESTSYRANAPKNVLEDGSNASDDIINDPIKISITGVVSDLYANTSPTSTSVLGVDVSTLGEVTSFLPDKTQAQLQVIEQINYRANQVIEQANRVERAAGDLYSFVTGSSDSVSKTLQESFIDHMEAIYFNKQLVDIEIENRTYSNMQISFRLNRDNKTDSYQFSIDAVQVSYVSLVFVPVQAQYSSPSKGVSAKIAGATDKGVQNPSDTSKAGSTSKSSSSKSILQSASDVLFGD